MLARLRNPDELLGDKDDRRCDAAVRAAHNDPEVVRLMLARPSGAAGAGIAALRAKMRERSEQGPKDERTPEHEVDDDALYRAMLEKHRSDQLKR